MMEKGWGSPRSRRGVRGRRYPQGKVEEVLCAWEGSATWVLGGTQRRGGAEGGGCRRGMSVLLFRPGTPMGGCTQTGAPSVASVDKETHTLIM